MKRVIVCLAISMIVGCDTQPVGDPLPPSDDQGSDSPSVTIEDIQNSTWLVVSFSDFSALFATAFAVDSNLLGTNAHVVEGIVSIMSEPNGQAWVFQHETGAQRKIRIVWTHPEYNTSAITVTPDIGLLEIEGEVPGFLSLPAENNLPEHNTFDAVSLCGFPGSVTIGIDVIGGITGDFHPRVSCLSGSISAIRPLDSGDTLTPENALLIQYDISTEPGLSGSAVFNDMNEVIAIHALGVSSEGEQNFGIRIDKLAELIRLASVGEVVGTDLSDIPQDNNNGSIACTPICDAAGFCDSDCDGWFDRVEIDLGGDPCDPFIPSFSPSTPADICFMPGGDGPPAISCPPICDSFGFCDSDCDGWYDRVEIAFDDDPCNPFDPPFSPNTPATICDDLDGRNILPDNPQYVRANIQLQSLDRWQSK